MNVVAPCDIINSIKLGRQVRKDRVPQGAGVGHEPLGHQGASQLPLEPGHGYKNRTLNLKMQVSFLKLIYYV